MAKKRKIENLTPLKTQSTASNAATVQRNVAERKEAAIEAFKLHDGNVSEVCKAVGISRVIFYRWVNNDEEFAERIREQEEAHFDFVESEIQKKIKSGDTTMLIFYAKTRLKKRGYVERQEVTGAEGKDLIPAKALSVTEAKNFLNKIENEC